MTRMRRSKFSTDGQEQTYQEQLPNFKYKFISALSVSRAAYKLEQIESDILLKRKNILLKITAKWTSVNSITLTNQFVFCLPLFIK